MRGEIAGQNEGGPRIGLLEGLPPLVAMDREEQDQGAGEERSTGRQTDSQSHGAGLRGRRWVGFGR